MLDVKNRRARARIDQRLAALKPARQFAPPASGWIRALRSSLGMSGVQLARRIGVASQTVDDMERSEAAQTITLRTLQRAAEALDCTLIYALVPNRSLNEMVEQRARQLARLGLSRVDRTMALEAQQVSDTSQEQQITDYIDETVRDRDLWDQN